MSVVTIDHGCNLCVDGDDFAQSPNGISCTFIRFGDTGLKLYRSEKLRDRSYSNQYALSVMGHAPKVGLKTIVTVNKDGLDCTYYAHETECIDDVFSYSHYEDLMEDVGCSEAYSYKDRWAHAACDLHDELSDTISWSDFHAGNVGFDSDGNTMIIDCADNLFGDGSIDSDL